MDKQAFDLDIIYDFKEYPDKHPGRCSNCRNVKFKKYSEEFWIHLESFRNVGKEIE
ncbi:hypothetical protein J2S09_004089 [Bacillus fengqiuensis]|nr:hypothetical protein [Bacillus fengqiuensis]